MRRFELLVILAVLLFSAAAGAAEFKLSNGDLLIGEIAQINEDGMVVRKNAGGFSEQIGWGLVSQETLRELLNNPQAKPFVEPFIEIPLEERRKARAQQKEIVIREVPRVERPAEKTSFFAGLMSPAGFMVLGILMLANLYAASEIATYKGRPIPLVVGAALVLPVIAPIIFLIMPESEAARAAAAEGHAGPAAPQEVVSAEAKVAGMQSSLGLKQDAKSGKPGQDMQVYKRSDTTFDRRFFETKFTGFFRVVPADPDMVLVVKTAKQEYVARRISRISMSEVHLQLLRGNTEVAVAFGEMAEVQVRHKDAKA